MNWCFNEHLDTSEGAARSAHGSQERLRIGLQGGWGLGPWPTVSPPDLQGQQPVVVGDPVLSGREEAGVDLHVVFVPVETGQRAVAGGVGGFEWEGFGASRTWAPTSTLCCLCDLGQHSHRSEPRLFSSVKWV